MEEELRLARASRQVSVSPTVPAYQVFAPTLGSPIGLSNSLSMPGFDPQRPLYVPGALNRYNSNGQLRGMSASTRGSLSSVSLDNSSLPGTGAVTPDTVTDSGAATPYSQPHGQRSSLGSPGASTFNNLLGCNNPWNNNYLNQDPASAMPDRNSALAWNFPTQAGNTFASAPRRQSATNTPAGSRPSSVAVPNAAPSGGLPNNSQQPW